MTDLHNTTHQEEWRQIPGYEGIYSVSNTGQVRRDSASMRGHAAGRRLKPHVDHDGYLRLTLFNRGAKRWFIHQVVAVAFIGPRPDGYTVNHIDGNKLNNTPKNLEYLTNRENHKHAQRMGLLASGDRHSSRTHPESLPRGSKHHKAKLIESDILRIREMIAEGLTQKKIAAQFGVSRQTITAINQRECWAHI